MSVTIAVLTAKGGTGKTTTAVNLAMGLGHRLDHEGRGDDVVLIDCDPQGNAGDYCGARPEMYHPATNPNGACLSRVLRGEMGAMDALVRVRDNVWLLPATKALNEAVEDITLLAATRAARGRGAESLRDVFKRRLKPLAAEARFVVLDCPPNPGLLEIPITDFADFVVSPVQLEYLSVMGVIQFVEALERLRSAERVKARFLCAVPSRTSTYRDGEPYQVAERQMLDDLVRVFGMERLAPAVEDGVKVKEAPGLHQSIFETAPHSPQARALGHLVNRVYAYGKS